MGSYTFISSSQVVEYLPFQKLVSLEIEILFFRCGHRDNEYFFSQEGCFNLKENKLLLLDHFKVLILVPPESGETRGNAWRMGVNRSSLAFRVPSINTTLRDTLIL